MHIWLIVSFDLIKKIIALEKIDTLWCVYNYNYVGQAKVVKQQQKTNKKRYNHKKNTKDKTKQKQGTQYNNYYYNKIQYKNKKTIKQN